jgi:hypothetical protein
MISNQILDFYDDKSKSVFQKIAGQIPKDLYQEKISEEINPENYAIRVLTKQGSLVNKFPVDSKLNTTLSNLYFSETHNQMHPAAQQVAAYHIKEACAKFGIKPSSTVESTAKSCETNFFDESQKHSFVGSFDKVAFDYSRDESMAYALPTEKKYAIPNETYLKKAERYFEENYRGFEPEQRLEFCENIVKQAGVLKTEVKSDLIKKYASSKYSKKLTQNLKSREPLCKEASHLKVLKKMHGFIEKTAAVDFAKALHEFDKKTGMTKYYDTKIKDPYLSVLDFEDMSKEATFKYVEKTSGKILKYNDLKSSLEKKASKIAEHFGQQLADGLKNNGIDAFEALPNDTKDIIAKIAIGAI